MSKSDKSSLPRRSDYFLEVKSKLDAEFRRFLLNCENIISFEEFLDVLKSLHLLGDNPFTVWYTDHEGDLLPINNNDNYACAVRNYLKSRRLFKLSLLRNAPLDELSKRTVSLNSSITSGLNTFKKVSSQTHPMISFPEDFRRVSAIIDIDIVPETCRRVKLMKSSGTDRPLGFYIRDGVSIRVTVDGMEKVPGVFISRLVAGGLAESTGLLAVNDEILEVNGIEVGGKSLDQVTDMMVANSNNLIITVKPVNQHNNITPRKQQQASPVAGKMKQHHRNISLGSNTLQNLKEVDEENLEENNNNDSFTDATTTDNNTNTINKTFGGNGFIGDNGSYDQMKGTTDQAKSGGEDGGRRDFSASLNKKVEILEL